MRSSKTAFFEELAENLWSDGWEANFNHVTWKSPASGMYPLAGPNLNGIVEREVCPHFKPTEKETTEPNAQNLESP